MCIQLLDSKPNNSELLPDWPPIYGKLLV